MQEKSKDAQSLDAKCHMRSSKLVTVFTCKLARKGILTASSVESSTTTLLYSRTVKLRLGTFVLNAARVLECRSRCCPVLPEEAPLNGSSLEQRDQGQMLVQNLESEGIRSRHQAR